MQEITITFPDGNKKNFPAGITAFEIAKSISHRLAKEALVANFNGKIIELNTPLNENGTIQFHTWDDKEGRSAFWHSSAHVLAQALLKLYPGIKLTIGPAIDQGFYYDIDTNGHKISEEDFPKIEKLFMELASKNAEFRMRQSTREEAINFYQKENNPYKLEIIHELPENEPITFCDHDDFTDLCRGGHIPHTGLIKAVKILNAAGAYWRGDENKPQLTRIYGISFPKKQMLDEWEKMMEEAKKRDHRKIGKELQLFAFSQKVGQGLPLWLPNGAAIRERLIEFMRRKQTEAGYLGVVTPHIGSKELYITSGHYEKYGADSFQPIKTPDEKEEFMLKPMNCPHHCEIYKTEPRSYKDLPLRLAEFGTVYRYEQSGELHGLTRVRGFTQDDAHIFCTPDQVEDEFKKVIDLVLLVFKTLGFNDYTAQISLRDPENKEKYIGSEENWQKAEQAIINAAKEKGLKTVIEYGEAAFYGPKLDFMVKDAIGRQWQLGTIQVDYNLPERFELEYTGADNQKHRPVMIHRAPFGSLERFMAILIEHNYGNFPLWLTNTQVIILPISEKFSEYSKNILNLLQQNEIRCSIDERNEKIGKKIRDAETRKIPYMIIIGEKEINENLLSVRKHGQGDIGKMPPGEFVEFLKQEIQKSYNL
ncbi:MAG: threonine--tRNA ligase [Vicingaceae bacterium]|nr:MAG: threonine--tRNA ligase [Vicingaceae bacterium]